MADFLIGGDEPHDRALRTFEAHVDDAYEARMERRERNGRKSKKSEEKCDRVTQGQAPMERSKPPRHGSGPNR